jgi:hypothetical protein
MSGLRAGDLEYLVKPVFEIDSYKSKIGDDDDVVVLSFTVDSQDPAKDLESFIEMGYNFILDADVSPGELDDGKFRVYVEMKRNRHVPEQIIEIIQGVKKVSGLDEMRFRYFKSFKSEEATFENLSAAIPITKNGYNSVTDEKRLDNFSEFFNRSSADEIQVMDESITFKKIYSGPLTFDIVTSGPAKEVYDSITGPIMLESKSMAEVMFLTKYIGNYNINKVGDNFIFENSGWAVALKRK